jgi:hypothetical protein
MEVNNELEPKGYLKIITGYVTEVHEDMFDAILNDKDGDFGGEKGDYIAKIPISLIIPAHRDRVAADYCFKWTFRDEDSEIEFFQWTAEDIAEAEKLAIEMKELFDQAFPPIKEKDAE